VFSEEHQFDLIHRIEIAQAIGEVPGTRCRSAAEQRLETPLSFMDMVRQHISVATDRPKHTVEQADAEVGGAAATLLEDGRINLIAIYTNDRAAFRGIERALSQHNYENHVQLIKAFDFADTVENRYQFPE
jgi:GAF domain-containing protein